MNILPSVMSFSNYSNKTVVLMVFCAVGGSFPFTLCGFFCELFVYLKPAERMWFSHAGEQWPWFQIHYWKGLLQLKVTKKFSSYVAFGSFFFDVVWMFSKVQSFITLSPYKEIFSLLMLLFVENNYCSSFRHSLWNVYAF